MHNATIRTAQGQTFAQVIDVQADRKREYGAAAVRNPEPVHAEWLKLSFRRFLYVLLLHVGDVSLMMDAVPLLSLRNLQPETKMIIVLLFTCVFQCAIY